MRRLVGFGLLVTATLLSTGCCWCRPWGHHRCCYERPALDLETHPAQRCAPRTASL